MDEQTNDFVRHLDNELNPRQKVKPVISEIAAFAVAKLKQCAEESGDLPRGTSGLSGLEEFLLCDAFKLHKKVIELEKNINTLSLNCAINQ